MFMTLRIRNTALALAVSAALAGCISLGPKAPEQLLTLTPAVSVPAGASQQGQVSAALGVQVPSTPQRLNVTRIPVVTSDSSLAYLEDAYWVEKPADLFRNLLAETIRSKGKLVVTGGELEYAARTQLTGQLVAMDYDAVSQSVIVTYEAVLEMPEGKVMTRRFSSSVAGVVAEPVAAGVAFNQAANEVANQVADWVR